MKSNIKILQKEQNYTAPAVMELDLLSEGVLCASPDLTIDDWVREDGILEF